MSENKVANNKTAWITAGNAQPGTVQSDKQQAVVLGSRNFKDSCHKFGENYPSSVGLRNMYSTYEREFEYVMHPNTKTNYGKKTVQEVDHRIFLLFQMVISNTDQLLENTRGTKQTHTYSSG